MNTKTILGVGGAIVAPGAVGIQAGRMILTSSMEPATKRKVLLGVGAAAILAAEFGGMSAMARRILYTCGGAAIGCASLHAEWAGQSITKPGDTRDESSRLPFGVGAMRQFAADFGIGDDA